MGQEPGAGNDDVVRPEAKGEEVEGDVYGMAVEVPRGDGHQDRAQHRVRSQRGDDQQSVQPFGLLVIISPWGRTENKSSAFEFFKHLS